MIDFADGGVLRQIDAAQAQPEPWRVAKSSNPRACAGDAWSRCFAHTLETNHIARRCMVQNSPVRAIAADPGTTMTRR
jgi:hypothetical protein